MDGRNVESIPPQLKQKLGFEKILACCAQAVRDGFEYVWIDTCCIEKRSSAELSEAINSMYRWYKSFTVCCIFLADVPNVGSIETQKQRFRESKWFTRGWTLQELIAVFFGDSWLHIGQGASLGTKLSLKMEKSKITRTPADGLRSNPIANYSAAQKLSWAARRQTTRIEDLAHSLLGLFNVNMPLLYGEGIRSFVRLQQEILNTSEDETLLPRRLEGIRRPFTKVSSHCHPIALKLQVESFQIFTAAVKLLRLLGLQCEMALPVISVIPKSKTF